MKQKLNADGLTQVLNAVNQRLAKYATSVFNTDAVWEADSLATLEGWTTWYPGGTAITTDTINGRTVENYDVYLALDVGEQYYYDSGTWIAFTPNMKDYYTKRESDSRFLTQTDFTERMNDELTHINASFAQRVTHGQLDEKLADIETHALTPEEINIILEETGFPTIDLP